MISNLVATLKEHEVEINKTGNLALASTPMGAFVECQNKVGQLASTVQNNSAALITLRTEISRVKSSASATLKQQPTEGSQEGTASYAGTVRGPPKPPSKEYLRECWLQEDKDAKLLRSSSLVLRGLPATTLVEAQEALFSFMTKHGLDISHVHGLVLIKGGAKSFMKFAVLYKSTKAAFFKLKKVLREQGCLVDDDLTPEERAEKLALIPKCNELWALGYTVRWKGIIIQFLGKLVPGGTYGWHDWHVGVLASADNIRPRPSAAGAPVEKAA